MSQAEERYTRLAALPLEVVVKASSRESFVTSVKRLLANLPLLRHLVRRDLKARYKDSLLGVFWSLVRPLTQLLIYYLVLGKFLGAERGIPDFAIYIFVGLTAYGLFSEVVSTGAASVVNNSGLVKKVYFPREILPLSAVASALVNFGVQVLILVAAMVALQSFPDPRNLILLVPAFLLVLTLATSLALVLSALNVYLRDVQYLVEVGTMILMWASPIVYSWTMVRGILGEGFLLSLYTVNPLTVAVLGFQRSLWSAGADATLFPENLVTLLWAETGIMIGVMCLAYIGFRRMQGNFAQAL